MAEVRCPICGKLNPPEADVCQYCQARIIPLITGQDTSSSTPSTTEAPFQNNPVSSPKDPIQPSNEEASEANLPDWLRAFRPDNEGTPPGDEPGEELPDWVAGGSSENEGVESAPSEGGGERLGDSGALDWLSGLRGESGGDLDQSPAPEDSSPEEWSQGGNEPGPLDEEEPGPPQVGPLPAAPVQPGGEAEPDWLRLLRERQNLGGIGAGELSGGRQSTSQDDSLETPGQPGPASQPTEKPPQEGASPGEPENSPKSHPLEENGPGLTPAELPTWLEALRPVEAAAPTPPGHDETVEQVESSGPLSGLRGLLPVGPEIGRGKKAAGYSVKLQVSEGQQSHAEVLEEVIKTEGRGGPPPGRPLISSQSFYRIVIFFVLLLAVAWPVYTGGQNVPVPAFAPEVYEANVLINNLSNGAPVLVAVDYQPGLSAEMDAASAPVVDHLMLKGAFLALVSTTPTGPAQAERLIGIVNARGHQYQGIQQFANLGFIPGGAAGLLGFAEAPRRITPFALDGSFVWQNSPLKAVTRLEDFALVLVLTENTDTARAWIEQVQPALGKTPLVMVVSAQAEPVVRPYVEGSPSQVQGLVVGLSGGASYERVLARAGLARQYWDSFSFGLAAAVALILIGGIANLVSGVQADRKRAEREGPA